MYFSSLGALFLAIGVALGAFGAHALRDRLTPDLLAVFETGARYQLIHGLALLFLGARSGLPARRSLAVGGWLLVAGTIVFSGSLYALALSGVRTWGAVTPLGGLCFLAGWLTLVRAFWPASK